MRWLITTLVTMLTGCTVSGGPADAQGAILDSLMLIETGIDREDPILASLPIGDHFYMGGNVGTRYDTGGWLPDGRGQGEFRLFFADAFETLANLDQQFTLLDWEQIGDVATAHVESRFDALRIDITPAQNVTFSGTDYMAFELRGDTWQLVRWDELPTAE